MEFTERPDPFAPNLLELTDVYGSELSFEEFSQKPEGWVGIVETDNGTKAVVVALRCPAAGDQPTSCVTKVLKYVGASGMHDHYNLEGPHAKVSPYVNPELITDPDDYTWSVLNPEDLHNIWELSFDADVAIGNAMQADIAEYGVVSKRTLGVLSVLNDRL